MKASDSVENVEEGRARASDWKITGRVKNFIAAIGNLKLSNVLE